MSAVLLCVMLALQDDAAAATAIDTFGKAWSKEKSPEGRAALVTELAKTVHDKVATKLSSLLTSEGKPVRLAAAAGLGTFTTTPELKKTASKGLVSALSAGANSNDPDVKVAILTALGLLQEESAATKIRDHFEDKDNKIAAAAVSAAGQIKSKAMIDPLIEIFRECEAEIKKMNAGSKPGKPAPLPKAPAANDPEKVKRDRANALLGPVQSALSGITNQAFKTSDEYEKWWVKNRSTFNPSK